MYCSSLAPDTSYITQKAPGKVNFVLDKADSNILISLLRLFFILSINFLL